MQLDLARTHKAVGRFAWDSGFAALLLCALIFFGFSAALADNRTVSQPPVDWSSGVNIDHPLVGKVWSRKANALTDAQDLGMTAAKARFILLGEVHDNVDHHRWQAWTIRNISKLRGARIVEGAPQIDIVAMEMLRADQIPALDKFYGRHKRVPRPLGPRAFKRLTKWDKSGWPDFSMYQPIIEVAVSESFILVPASPSRDESGRVSKQGYDALTPNDVTALKLDTPFSEPNQMALTKEIDDGHCGVLPKEAFAPMAKVQRFRDAVMADALLNVSNEKGGILIAGNSHVRRDRAVPWYLMQRGVKSENIISIVHREVAPGITAPEAYVPRDPSGVPSVDFVVFTPGPKEREDMCEKMRKHMQKKREDQAAAEQDKKAE